MTTDQTLRAGRFALPVDAAAVARDWQARGYDCQPFSDPPGREWNDFTHPTDELVTVIEGRLRLTLGNRAIELGPGDEAHIPAGALHSVKSVGHATTHWLFGYEG